MALSSLIIKVCVLEDPLTDVAVLPGDLEAVLLLGLDLNPRVGDRTLDMTGDPLGLVTDEPPRFGDRTLDMTGDPLGLVTGEPPRFKSALNFAFRSSKGSTE